MATGCQPGRNKSQPFRFYETLMVYGRGHCYESMHKPNDFYEKLLINRLVFSKHKHERERHGRFESCAAFCHWAVWCLHVACEWIVSIASDISIFHSIDPPLRPSHLESPCLSPPHTAQPSSQRILSNHHSHLFTILNSNAFESIVRSIDRQRNRNFSRIISFEMAPKWNNRKILTPSQSTPATTTIQIIVNDCAPANNK